MIQGRKNIFVLASKCWVLKHLMKNSSPRDKEKSFTFCFTEISDTLRENSRKAGAQAVDQLNNRQYWWFDLSSSWWTAREWAQKRNQSRFFQELGLPAQSLKLKYIQWTEIRANSHILEDRTLECFWIFEKNWSHDLSVIYLKIVADLVPITD